MYFPYFASNSLKMSLLLNKDKQVLYHLDFQLSHLDFIKSLLNKYGYKLYQIKTFEDFIQTIEDSAQKTLAKSAIKLNKPIFLEENLEKQEHIAFFNSLLYTLHWLTNVFDQFGIGFSIFNKSRHILFNTSFMEYIYSDYSNYQSLKVGDTLIHEDRKAFRREVVQLVSSKKERAKLQIHSVTMESKIVRSLLFIGFATQIEGDGFVIGYFMDSQENNSRYLEVMINEANILIENLVQVHHLSDISREPAHLFQQHPVKNVHFTKREQEVLHLIFEGLSNKEMAGKLNIGVRTVETHRANMLSKTNTKNTAGLIRFALRNRFLH